MAKPTEEQIQELKELLQNLEAARQDAENLANSTKETLEAATGNLGQQYTDLVDEIKGALKKQYEFLSSQELSAEIQLKLIQKQKEERAKLVRLQQKQLGILENLSDAQRSAASAAEQLTRNETERLRLTQELDAAEKATRKDTAKIAKLKQDISKSEKEQQSIINRQSTAQAKVTSLTEKAVQSGIEENDIKDKTVQELENLINAQEVAIEKQRELTKESDRTSNNVRDSQSRLKNNNAIIDNTISKFTGLKAVTGGFADLILEAGGDQDKLNELAAQFGHRLKLATSPAVLILNTFSKINAVISDVTTKVNGLIFGVKSLATDIIESPITFRRDTGLTRALGVQLGELKRSSAGAGFSINETDLAFRGLSKSMVSFTRMGAQSRRFLTEQARLFQRAGLMSENFGKAVEGLTKTMGMSGPNAAALTDEIMAFGGVVGIDVNTVVKDFTSNLDLLATFGREKGVTIFKNLAAAANQAGVEIRDLNTVANQFETFDSAMHAAGKLNFVLKGPFLNSMELLQAAPDQTLDILRKGFDKAGKSFDDFGRRGREAIAKTLGVGVDVAKKLFDDRSLKSAKDLEKSLMSRARAAKTINDQTLKELTLQQKQELMYEKVLQALMPLADSINKFFNMFYDFLNSDAGTIFMTAMVGIGNAMKFLVPLMLTFVGNKAMGALAVKLTSFLGIGQSVAAGFKKIGLAVSGATMAVMGYMSAKSQLIEIDKAYEQGLITQEEREQRRESAGTGAGISGALAGAQLAGLAASSSGNPFVIGGAALVGGVAGYFGMQSAVGLNNGVENFNAQGASPPASPMRLGVRDAGAAFLGDAPGGVMTSYTEGAFLPTGTTVLNSRDTRSLTEAVKAMPAMVDMLSQAISDSVGAAIATVDNKNRQNDENVQLNLVIKMEEQPVVDIARRTSMEVLRRGLEIA